MQIQKNCSDMGKKACVFLLFILGIISTGCKSPSNTALPAKNIYKEVADTIPNYDVSDTKNIKLTHTGSAFTANYHHSAAYAGMPAIEETPCDGRYYICLDPPEMKSGSKYGLYGLTEDGMTLHENIYISLDFSLLGENYLPNYGYTIYNEKAYLTYDPYNAQENKNVKLEHLFYDPQTQITEGMFCISRKQAGNQYSAYPIIADLKRGTTIDFLKQLSPAVSKKAIEDGAELVAASGRQYLLRIGTANYYFYNHATKKLVEINNIAKEAQIQLNAFHRFVRTDIGSSDNILFFYCTNLDEVEYFLCDGKQGSVVRISDYFEEEIIACTIVNDRIICRGMNDIWSLDLNTHKASKLLQNVKVVYSFDFQTQNNATFVIYSTKAGDYCVYDFVLDKVFLLIDKGTWPSVGGENCVVSPDGRKMIAYYIDDKKTVQFMLLDCDQQSLTSFSRTNPNVVEESRIWWHSNERIAVSTSDFRDCYVYMIANNM